MTAREPQERHEPPHPTPASTGLAAERWQRQQSGWERPVGHDASPRPAEGAGSESTPQLLAHGVGFLCLSWPRCLLALVSEMGPP